MPTINLVPPVVLEIDIPITRRLKLHAVVIGDGEQVFHSRRLSEVFQFLLEHEVVEFLMMDGHAEFRIRILPPLSPPSQTKG